MFDPELQPLADLAASLHATMSLGADTVVVNGNRFATPTWDSYNPTNYGPQTTGVPQVSPSMPPYLGGSPVNNSMLEGVGGYGTAGNNNLMTQVANANPWNLRVSPVVWAIVGLLLSIFLLRHVHWRETILESAREEARFGPVSEGAHEEVA